ncbi:MAG: STN domain-containing protein, partial [Pedobacter sp.]
MKLRYLLLIFYLFCSPGLKAQHSPAIPQLYRRISIAAEKQPLGEVLNQISRRANFIFSYGGTVVNPDSLVSLNLKNETVRNILDRLFQGRADYRQSGNYVIIRSTILRFSIQPDIIKTDRRHYLISG